MASAAGTTVPAIARLVAADADTVHDVIHAFDQRGLAALDPQWAGGRPRLINDADLAFITATAKTDRASWVARSPGGRAQARRSSRRPFWRAPDRDRP
ncbi:helix-turn-helix domain-containing protein [Pseudonocardia sp.]|jgi:transposase|uniref:helix-turn-helix domain-containing protein n=1 Tax=Pseudonocardia sp. TaxID=60912 RepID=UPI002604AFDD|nr:helix-turn-helix domain-containing protein [Pseudonocardia sp.]